MKTEAGKLERYYIDQRTGTAHKVFCLGKNRSRIKTTVNVLIKWKLHRRLFYLNVGMFVDLIIMDYTASLVENKFTEFSCWSIKLIASIGSSRSKNFVQKSKIRFSIQGKCSEQFQTFLSEGVSIRPYHGRNWSVNWGGGWIFIYSCSVRRISFQINLNDSWFQKKFVGQNKKIWIFTPPINALVSPLDPTFYFFGIMNAS